MGFEYVYRVDVTDRQVTGYLDTPDSPGGSFGPELMVGTERVLRRKTIEVLRAWLNRWTALTRMSQQDEYEHLMVHDTFAVLGQHLYATVFFGEVERGFLAGRRAARENSATLRVSLRFDTAADDLAQLPWELLHADGEFLAKGHRLVLSRSLLLQGGLITTIPREPPLVVQFLVTIPETEAYREQRTNLLDALTQLTEYSTSISSNVQDHWDWDEAAKVLRTPPYPQVVHVIGVCRHVRSPDQQGMQIYLDDGEGPRWRNGEMLVSLFSRNEDLARVDRVRLVVLHLCEPSPLDFEATFERLAPDLIRQGIPAVIAMQYPLSGRAAGRFVKKLYEGLAERQSIEEAVQEARSDLFTRFEEDRLFGSPVLYMQSVDSQLLPPPAAGANAGPTSFLQPPSSPRSPLDWLLQKLAALDEPLGPRNEAEEMLRKLPDWPPQLSEAERRVSRLVRDYAYRPELARVFLTLVKAVQQEMTRREF